MKLALKLLLLLPLIAMSNTATSEELYNVKDFVFFGVSLGTSSDEVIEGLSKHYSISPDELKIRNHRGSDEVDTIKYIADGIRVTAFMKDNANNENVLNLLWIVLQKDNYDTLIKSATDKFGVHSIRRPNPIGKPNKHSWCEKVNAAKDHCELDTDVLMIDKSRLKNRISVVLMNDYRP